MSQPITAAIGQRIARYRKMNGWSAQQLASNTDGAVSRDTIANLENGRRTDMTVRQFLTIALALRIPPDALLTDLEHPLEPSTIHFPGPAPAPLERAAPQITVAGWLAGRGDNDTTNAARWVSQVTALLTDYVVATDIAEIHDALDRIAAAPPDDERDRLAARRRTTRAELLALGVHVPASD